jgi:hypothetical protein
MRTPFLSFHNGGSWYPFLDPCLLNIDYLPCVILFS